jgi:endonuclease YncB( thermonuclease family)
VSIRVALALGLFALFAFAVNADEHPACRLISLETTHARAVEDGRTLILADGRVVRLAGIEVPDGSAAAKTALESFVTGHEITLWRLGKAETDRYGRVVAVVTAGGAEAGIAASAQKTLLAQGLARVAAKVGNRGCAATLHAEENAARIAGLGVWADPAYVVRNAEDLAGIKSAQGHLAVVEGKVLSVRESGATIYVNFGRRWSDDFTVTVPKRNERTFTAEGVNLRKLGGRTVRIRGTIEERGGPWIEATAPEQIEVESE